MRNIADNYNIGSNTSKVAKLLKGGITVSAVLGRENLILAKLSSCVLRTPA